MNTKLLLQIAKDAIYEELSGEKLTDRYKLDDELSQKRAVFVTINKRSSLRGCIGSLVAHRTLFEDIVHNAKAAAFNDMRFKPVTLDEFDELEIEISILTEPKILNYDDVLDLKNKIRVGIDGVILKLNSNQATFLPSVWQQLPTFELFFSHLCQKARLNQDCLKLHPKIFTYEAIKIK